MTILGSVSSRSVKENGRYEYPLRNKDGSPFMKSIVPTKITVNDATAEIKMNFFLVSGRLKSWKKMISTSIKANGKVAAFSFDPSASAKLNTQKIKQIILFCET